MPALFCGVEYFHTVCHLSIVCEAGNSKRFSMGRDETVDWTTRYQLNACWQAWRLSAGKRVSDGVF